MASDNFEDVLWGKEKISADKLNAMTANDRWVYEHAIQGYYDVYGIARETGLTIRAGYVKASPTESLSLFADHYFPKPFLPGTRPVIVLGFVSGGPLNIVVAARGLDGRGIPDHRGFRAHFTQLREEGGPTKFVGSDQWCSYIALGTNG